MLLTELSTNRWGDMVRYELYILYIVSSKLICHIYRLYFIRINTNPNPTNANPKYGTSVPHTEIDYKNRQDSDKSILDQK